MFNAMFHGDVYREMFHTMFHGLDFTVNVSRYVSQRQIAVISILLLKNRIFKELYLPKGAIIVQNNRNYVNLPVLIL